MNANSKDELLAREAHYIKTLACVNRCTPLQTPKEHYDANKDKFKGYYNANKDDRLAYQKLYDEANKDKINQRKREAYQKKKQKQQITV